MKEDIANSSVLWKITTFITILLNKIMTLLKILILTLTCTLTYSVVAQDKIQLMNGKVLRGKLKAEFDDYYNFEYYKNGGKTKSMELSKYRIFSKTDAQGVESILYKQDTLMGNYYSENEMKMYIYGQRDAFKSYKGTPMFVSTFAIGFMSVLVDTYEFEEGNSCPPGFFNRTPSIGPIIVPFALTIGAGLLKSKIRREHAADVSFLSNEYYISGFQKVSKVKRVKNAFFGSVAGVVSGFIAYSFAHQDCP